MDAETYKYVQKFFDAIVNPIVRLLFAAAIFYFVWGVFRMIWKSDDSDARTEGVNHILWGTVGLFIMVSVWGIITFIEKTVAR